MRLSPELEAKILATEGVRVTGGKSFAPEIKKPSKYHAQPTEYNGVRYASKAEAAFATALDMKSARLWWIGQPKFRLGVPENVYIADFLVVPLDGDTYVVDVKGMMTSKFKRDLKLWSKYGPCPLHVVTGKTVTVYEGRL